AVIPLYAIGLVSSYFGSRFVTVLFNGQSAGTYDHYFGLFLSPVDVLWSFLKVMLFSVVVILIHCYCGYRATGGRAGVGVAVGRAVRTVIVMINIIDFLMSLAIWGATTTVRVAGWDRPQHRPRSGADWSAWGSCWSLPCWCGCPWACETSRSHRWRC